MTIHHHPFIRKLFCYITIDVLNEVKNSPLHLTRYFYGGDRYAKEKNKMAKENVNVADELKDERQKANLLAREICVRNISSLTVKTNSRWKNHR